MDYKIVKKESFKVLGAAKRFDYETCKEKIPKFWQEHITSGGSRKICGQFGICLDGEGKNFDYLIADIYKPWEEVPEGCITRVIPEGTCAVFPCRGALPKALQDVNTQIWSEWLPNCRDYKLGGNYDIEMYTKPADDPKDNYCEIWVPVVKA